MQALLVLQQGMGILESDNPLYYKLLVEYAQVQLKLGEYQRADKVVKRLLSVKVLKDDQQTYLTLQVLQAKAYLQAGAFKAAIEQSLSGLERTFHTRFLQEQAMLQHILATSYAQLQQYKQAHQYLKRYETTQNALNLQKRNNKVLQLEAQLVLDRQRQQVLMLEKDNVLQAQEIERQNQVLENTRLTQQRYVLLAVILMFVLGFTYWRWQNKRALVLLEAEVAARTKELAEQNEKLKALSFTDSLTGLHNRHYFFSYIDELLPKLTAEHDLVFALIDIDHFKSINDTYGHAAGDQVLEEFANILRSQFREDDLITRWGGEEFLVLIPNATSKQLPPLMERVRHAVASHTFLSGAKGRQVTCSMGYAQLSLSGQTALDKNWEWVVELADTCLYIAKETRRNAWVGAEPMAGLNEHEVLELVNNSRKLIKDKKISVQISHEDILDKM